MEVSEVAHEEAAEPMQVQQQQQPTTVAADDVDWEEVCPEVQKATGHARDIPQSVDTVRNVESAFNDETSQVALGGTQPLPVQIPRRRCFAYRAPLGTHATNMLRSSWRAVDHLLATGDYV
jgi:hypothetical protein